MDFESLQLPRYISGACSFAHLKCNLRNVFFFGDHHMGTKHICSPCKKPDCMTVDDWIMNVTKQQPGLQNILLTEFRIPDGKVRWGDRSHPYPFMYGARVNKTTLEARPETKSLRILNCDGRMNGIFLLINRLHVSLLMTPRTTELDNQILKSCQRWGEIGLVPILKLIFFTKKSRRKLEKMNISDLINIELNDFDSEGIHVFFKWYNALSDHQKPIFHKIFSVSAQQIEKEQLEIRKKTIILRRFQTSKILRQDKNPKLPHEHLFWMLEENLRHMTSWIMDMFMTIQILYFSDASSSARSVFIKAGYEHVESCVNLLVYHSDMRCELKWKSRRNPVDLERNRCMNYFLVKRRRQQANLTSHS